MLARLVELGDPQAVAFTRNLAHNLDDPAAYALLCQVAQAQSDPAEREAFAVVQRRLTPSQVAAIREKESQGGGMMMRPMHPWKNKAEMNALADQGNSKLRRGEVIAYHEQRALLDREHPGTLLGEKRRLSEAQNRYTGLVDLRRHDPEPMNRAIADARAEKGIFHPEDRARLAAGFAEAMIQRNRYPAYDETRAWLQHAQLQRNDFVALHPRANPWIDELDPAMAPEEHVHLFNLEGDHTGFLQAIKDERAARKGILPLAADGRTPDERLLHALGKPRGQAVDDLPKTAAQHDARRQALTEGRILAHTIKPLGGGLNETNLGVLVHDNVAYHVVIKPEAALESNWRNSDVPTSELAYFEPLRSSIPPKADLSREVAANIVHRAMGFPAKMPTAVVREVPGHGRSLVMDFVAPNERWNPARSIGHAYFAREEETGAVFDAVIGNLDRHQMNLLTAPDKNGKDHLVLIDHGLSFPDPALDASYAQAGAHEHLMTVYGDAPLSIRHQAALDRLQKQRPQVTRELAAAGLTKTAIDDMWDRVDWLQASGTIPSSFGTMDLGEWHPED